MHIGEEARGLCSEMEHSGHTQRFRNQWGDLLVRLLSALHIYWQALQPMPAAGLRPGVDGAAHAHDQENNDDPAGAEDATAGVDQGGAAPGPATAGDLLEPMPRLRGYFLRDALRHWVAARRDRFPQDPGPNGPYARRMQERCRHHIERLEGDNGSWINGRLHQIREDLRLDLDRVLVRLREGRRVFWPRQSHNIAAAEML